MQLSLLDQTAARFVRTNWPAEWAVMQEGLIEKSQGGPPPSSDTRGVLLEFPVFGGSGRGGPGGEHWLILELDLAYARDRWLPELIARHLNPAGSVVNEARISLEGRSPGVLHATTGAAEKPREGIISVRFNRLGKTARRSDMPGQTSGAWLLEAWQRPGALEAVVAAARRRNFGVAVCINLLMLATGVALMHHTRRSRRLAEQQMNFVANVSHEFRTPLTVIRGAAHNLKRGVVQEPEQVGQYSCLIAQHAERLGELVEQVLEFAGAKKNQASAPRQPVALAEVLKEAIAATEHEAQAARCRVELKVLPSLPTVSGDAPALRRVFQNLITNAAKHGGDGGWIGITAASANGSGPAMVEVQVADYGPGIPESEQAEIFKPFFRGARAQEKQTRGSGLGLSLVREIVEAHGGAISVRSTDNCGTTFTIRLPAAAETKPE
ncbi:MAG: HAMP domain-containing histidine kinase [Verrucomicrobia bacterium]|nr:HAMP domain-containing histidine kinase [Verrucomicrobiota bacterium]